MRKNKENDVLAKKARSSDRQCLFVYL